MYESDQVEYLETKLLTCEAAAYTHDLALTQRYTRTRSNPATASHLVLLFNPPMSCLSSPDRPFQALQAQLRDRWQDLELDPSHDCDIVIIPSLSVDQRELEKIDGALHYEERLLFSLIRLRNPRTRLIYLTSQPLPPIVIDYYLQLLPGIPFSHARNRLLLLSTYDSSPRPLTQKILERPRLIQRLRQALRPQRAFMVCFNVSKLEEQLSVQLGIPLFGAPPTLLTWGTKQGSRQIFAECAVPHPDGSELVYSATELADRAAALWERQAALKRIVIKLNEGFSGEGNALLDLRPLAEVAPGRGTPAERRLVLQNQFEHLSFQAAAETWASFGSRVPELGAIAEAFIEGEVKRSPSVQGSISPTGQVEILSTHDQILGGPDGQIYLGCEFPADERYRLQLQDYGRRIGECLAAKGAMERFGVDFVVVQQPDGQWDCQAIEINLRKGGTTHPFMTLQYLTNGSYNEKDGLFYSQPGSPKYYKATDNLQAKHYRGLLPSDLMDIVAEYQLHFDSGTKTGTVFHLMGCLSEFGKLGLTCVGDSPHHALEIYDRVKAVLDEACQAEAIALPTGWTMLPMGWTGYPTTD